MSVPSPLDSLIRRVQELLQRLDKLITTIKGNIRISYAVVGISSFLGGALTTYLLIADRGHGTENLMKLGPWLVSLIVSAIPLKFLLDSRERMISYEDLRSRCSNAQDLTHDELLELKMDVEEAIKELRKR
jgi:hypothetical protein